MLALFKGAGEFGSAAAHQLYRLGLDIVMTELPQPLCVRRKVSFAEGVYAGTTTVDSVPAGLAASLEQIRTLLAQRTIAVVVDPDNTIRYQLRPTIVVDARMLKRPTDTRPDEAPIVIGLGPGFVAGQDVHAVIETNRGPHLGRVIYQGSAEPYTGVPAPVEGHTTDRVLRAPCSGQFEAIRDIGDHVEIGDRVGRVADRVITAPISGVIRGLLHSGVQVMTGLKLGDIDPRNMRAYCFMISDKGQAIGRGVAQACIHLLRERGLDLTLRLA